METAPQTSPPDEAAGLAAALADIEQRAARLEDSDALIQALDRIAASGRPTGEAGVRYAVARGILLNRLEVPESALVEFQRAREEAEGCGARHLASAISREMGRVAAWRSDTEAAAHEILRAILEADRAGNRGDLVQAAVLYGQLGLENGRHESAAWVFREVLDPAGTLVSHLTPRDRSRAPRNACETLVEMGAFEECLRDALPVALRAAEGTPRDAFELRLIEVRCLAETGRSEEAAAALARARGIFGDDPQPFEAAQYDLLAGFLRRRSDPEAAVPLIRGALARFVEQDVPRHEFWAHVLLIETLFALDRRTEAEQCVIDALRRAEARKRPVAADRIRTAAFPHWQSEMLPSLAPEDATTEGDRGRSRFLIREALGDGGFGIVHRAIDTATGAEVAIKRFKRRKDAEAGSSRGVLNTIRNEVRSAARYQSAFVARTRYVTIDDRGDVVLVQDFIPGPTLARALADGVLGRAERLEVAAVLARVVRSLHEAGIAHRDLKPGNIVLRHGRQPVIIDLGLARLRGLVDTTRGFWTEAYAPPEQRRGLTSDRWLGREDIYALGRIIAELVGVPQHRHGGAWWRRALVRRRRGAGDPLAAAIATMLEERVERRSVDLGIVADLLIAANDRPGP